MPITAPRLARDVRIPKQYLSDNPAICSEVEAKAEGKYELPGAEGPWRQPKPSKQPPNRRKGHKRNLVRMP